MFSEYANEQIKSSLNLENDFEMYSLDNLLANDNKNYNLNSSLESNPPVVDLLLSENQPLSNENDLPSSIEQNYERDSSDTIDSLVENIRLNKKRGRKNDKIEPQHTLFKNDCKMAKIQTNYISFLIIFFNSIMKSYNLNYKFLQLEGKFKSNINQKFRSILNKKTIKEILFSYPISKKYKNYNKFHNVEIINKLEEEGQADILNLLDKNLLFFFDIFFESKKIFDLSSFGLGNLTVKLPSKTKLFDDLIKKTKHENPDKYELEMKRCKYKFFS